MQGIDICTSDTSINPADLGLYYLNSRYYDQEIGRFISADSLLVANDLLGYNMYSYCTNNPICYSDSNGNMKEWVLDGVVYNYDGTAADFHRLEHGKSPLAYEQAVQKQKAAYAATVYAEAAAYNEPSKKAVAHVINNRVGTPTVDGKKTRNTILDVVSEPAQFSSYENSWYNEAMVYYTTGICENEYNRRVLKQCMAIVIEIYDYGTKDITDGCTYFYSPISMKPQGRQPDWVNGKTEVKVDGVDPWYFRFYK